MTDGAVAAVVLAAGAASRFGAPKQRLLLPGVLARVRAGGLTEIVVVAGAHPVEVEGVELEGVEAETRVVDCADWERGPGASLRCGLGAVSPAAAAAVVVLADGPDLAPQSIKRVIEAWSGSASPLVAASYAGLRGHPLLIARSIWAVVPDEGLRSHAPLLVPCDDFGHPGDVDRPEDLPERLRRR